MPNPKEHQSGAATLGDRETTDAKVKRVCSCLEAEGLITANGIKIGGTRFIKIECPKSSTAAAAHSKETIEIGGKRSIEILEERPQERAKFEKIVTHILARAQRALHKAQLNVEPVRVGKWIFVAIRETTTSENSGLSLSPKELSTAAAIPGGDRALGQSHDMANRVARKLQNSAGNPTMTILEVAHALGKSQATIYRMLDDGILSRTQMPGRVRIPTESVKSLLRNRSDEYLDDQHSF